MLPSRSKNLPPYQILILSQSELVISSRACIINLGFWKMENKRKLISVKQEFNKN
jgi:hypothetical protein